MLPIRNPEPYAADARPRSSGGVTRISSARPEMVNIVDPRPPRDRAINSPAVPRRVGDGDARRRDDQQTGEIDRPFGKPSSSLPATGAKISRVNANAEMIRLTAARETPKLDA